MSTRSDSRNANGNKAANSFARHEGIEFASRALVVVRLILAVPFFILRAMVVIGSLAAWPDACSCTTWCRCAMRCWRSWSLAEDRILPNRHASA